MPHLGRESPYLPQYWAGEGWFWPHFLPWKYKVTLYPAFSGPFLHLPEKHDLITDPGECPPDCKTASWRLAFEEGIHDHVLTITASYHRDELAQELQWYLLWNLDGVDFASALSWVPVYTGSNSPAGWFEGTDLILGGPCDPPGGNTLVALYSEGGSPFPHPTGGPPPP